MIHNEVTKICRRADILSALKTGLLVQLSGYRVFYHDGTHNRLSRSTTSNIIRAAGYVSEPLPGEGKPAAIIFDPAGPAPQLTPEQSTAVAEFRTCTQHKANIPASVRREAVALMTDLLKAQGPTKFAALYEAMRVLTENQPEFAAIFGASTQNTTYKRCNDLLRAEHRRNEASNNSGIRRVTTGVFAFLENPPSALPVITTELPQQSVEELPPTETADNLSLLTAEQPDTTFGAEPSATAEAL